jgi:hypothetical protein
MDEIDLSNYNIMVVNNKYSASKSFFIINKELWPNSNNTVNHHLYFAEYAFDFIPDCEIKITKNRTGNAYFALNLVKQVLCITDLNSNLTLTKEDETYIKLKYGI